MLLQSSSIFVHLTILQSDDLLVLLLSDSSQSVQMFQRQLQDNCLLQMSERLRGHETKVRPLLSRKRTFEVVSGNHLKTLRRVAVSPIASDVRVISLSAGRYIR